MNNLLIIGAISLASLNLGYIKYCTLADQYKGKPWQLKFIEIWNDFMNFFLAGMVGYYFISIRLPRLINGEELGFGDFFLFVVFALGMFGHLCVMSKNITEGIQAILKRVLE